MKPRVIVLAVALFIGIGLVSYAASADKISRMTIEQLRPLLGNPDVVVLDGRIAREWDTSPIKIKGAIRADLRTNVKTLMERIPKNKTLVFYCE
jgi:hypothetical protein